MIRGMAPGPEPDGWLAAVVPLLGVHVYVAEMDADESYRVTLLANAELMLGGAPEGGVVDDTWDERVHPDDRQEYDRVFAYSELALGDPVQFEYRLVGFDGVTRWVLDRCVPRLSPEDGTLTLEGVVIDVSERQALVEELAEARDTIERIAQSIDEVFYTYELLDSDRWRWLFTTPGLGRLLGLGDGDRAAIGLSEDDWDASVHPDDREVYAEVGRLQEGEAIDIEFRIVGADGKTRWMHARDRPRGTGLPLIVDGVIADVTERKLDELALEGAHAEAEHRSRTDALTGLYNRRHFSDVLAAELARATRETTTPGLLLIDLDHFKQVNDQHGHGAGDDVLIEVAARIRTVLRPYDIVARFGGEEFVVLAPSVPDELVLRRIAEHVRLAIGDRAFATRAGELRLTATVGAVRATGQLYDTDALLDAADRAMYSAKNRGRNAVGLFADLDERAALDAEPESVRLARAVALAASVRTSVRAATPEPHAEQVASMAMRIARELRLEPAIELRCRVAGWLHDVGHGALPDDLLAKVGSLDDDELALMRAHPAIGAGLIESISGLEGAAPGVRHHHERYDGSGYPDGLVGDKIPIEARIVAAAEAYSAMTARSIYRPSRSQQGAMRELRARAGTQFDPAVIAALFAILEREHRAAERRMRAVGD